MSLVVVCSSFHVQRFAFDIVPNEDAVSNVYFPYEMINNTTYDVRKTYEIYVHHASLSGGLKILLQIDFSFMFSIVFGCFANTSL
jgi:hypothetical protein